MEEQSASESCVTIPRITFQTMRALCSDIKTQVEKLQNTRYVWGDDRIDKKTISDIRKLNGLFSDLAAGKSVGIERDDKIIRQCQSQIALQSDQITSLRDSLQLGNFRELRLIKKIDEQRNSLRESQKSIADLRQKIEKLEGAEKEKQEGKEVDVTVNVNVVMQ